MTPPLAAPRVKLESLLTMDLTVPPQVNKPRFSPLHVHGFLELELNREADSPLCTLFGPQ